jgi:hypothetical protein
MAFCTPSWRMRIATLLHCGTPTSSAGKKTKVLMLASSRFATRIVSASRDGSAPKRSPKVSLSIAASSSGTL